MHIKIVICIVAFFGFFIAKSDNLEPVTSYWTDEGNYSTEWFNEEASAFYISTAQELAGLSVLINKFNTDFTSKSVELTDDIDLLAHEWTPIGSNREGTAFNGTFDGDNFTINNMYINTQPKVNCYGLFGFCSNAKIMNVIIANGSVNAMSNCVAGIVGQSFFTEVSNCENYADCSGSWYVAGICGYSYKSAVYNCTNGGSHYGDGYVAGIAAVCYDMPVHDCVNTAYVSGNSSIGGISGFFGGNNADILNCINYGTVEGVINVGGIAGNGYEAYFINGCHNKGAVIASSENAGGIVGIAGAASSVLNCYNSGKITSTHAAGGIAGWIIATSNYYNCYNIGDVCADNSAGGIAGYSEANIENANISNCYNTGIVDAVDDKGAVIGFATEQTLITDAFYLNACIDENNEYGISMQQDEMQSSDFVIRLNDNALQHNMCLVDELKWKSWTINSSANDGYPYFDTFFAMMKQYTSNNIINVSPNPAVDYISIKTKSNDAVKKIIIRDIKGSTVYNFDFNGENINISNLRSGIYLLTAIFTNGIKSAVKVVVE